MCAEKSSEKEFFNNNLMKNLFSMSNFYEYEFIATL